MRTETRHTKLRALVVDDEPLARSNLLVLLRKDAEVESVGECESGVEAVREIRRTQPDLVFLDVQMPECDGFDVLEMLGSGVAPTVVFVTAHDEYALRAFDAGALDYLLKPFDDARFQRALNRAKDKLAHYAERGARAVERLVVKKRRSDTVPQRIGDRLDRSGELLRLPARRRKSSFCGGAWLSWKRSWSRPCFAEFIVRRW